MPEALPHRCLALAIARPALYLARARCWDPIAPPSSPVPPADASGLVESSPNANILSSLHIGLVLVLLHASLLIGLVLVLLHAALHKAEDNATDEVDRWYAPVSQQPSH